MNAAAELAAAANNYVILASRQLTDDENRITDIMLGMPTAEFPAGYYGWPWGYDLWLPSVQPEQNMAKAAELLDEAIVAYTTEVY